MTINGAQVDAAEHRTIFSPSTGEPVGQAPVATLADLDSAVEAANAAQVEWSRASDETRREACQKIAGIIETNMGELSRLLTLEQGKPLKGMGSEFEVGGCMAWAGAAASFELPVKVLQDDETARIEQHRTPVGVVGSITPWNWPLMIAIWHLAPAIRAGNAVVIKPSPYTPLSTLRMIALIAEAVPPGVLNVVSGGDDIGAGISGHDGIAKVVFTGSTATGKAIMKSAAGNLKRLTLELGGNDAGIVLPDADPKAIAEGVFWGAFINNGQTCAALKRLYVHDSLYDDMCAALVEVAGQIPMGDGLDEGNLLGPVQNKAQFDKVSALVEDAKKAGGRILTGGEPKGGPGYFYPVTLIADVSDGVRIVDEEQFGPVLPIIRYSDVEDALSRANGLDFGLGASVWSQDMDAARSVAERMEAGTVYINKHGEVLPHVPFGGVKGSGVGVEFGVEGLEAYTDIKILSFAKAG
ncbi:MAG: aldehyde dehydrogenase family protein [Pseudomonadota bacterium]